MGLFFDSINYQPNPPTANCQLQLQTSTKFRIFHQTTMETPLALPLFCSSK